MQLHPWVGLHGPISCEVEQVGDGDSEGGGKLGLASDVAQQRLVRIVRRQPRLRAHMRTRARYARGGQWGHVRRRSGSQTAMCQAISSGMPQAACHCMQPHMERVNAQMPHARAADT